MQLDLLQETVIKIQVVGLPGTGKTTAIKEFIDHNKDLDISYVDLADYAGKYRTYAFTQTIKSSSKNLIAESATGFFIPNTISIHYHKPMSLVAENLTSRGDSLDYDYLSLQSGQIIPTQYTMTTKSGLIALLEKLYKEC